MSRRRLPSQPGLPRAVGSLRGAKLLVDLRNLDRDFCPNQGGVLQTLGVVTRVASPDYDRGFTQTAGLGELVWGVVWDAVTAGSRAPYSVGPGVGVARDVSAGPGCPPGVVRGIGFDGVTPLWIETRGTFPLCGPKLSNFLDIARVQRICAD